MLGYFTKASVPPLLPPFLPPLPSLPPPLLPRAPRFLVQQLAANVPYKGRPAAVLELHLRSLLYVTDYQPGLRQEVLRLAVEQLVQLDVELPHLSLESPPAGHEGAALGGGELLFEVDMVSVLSAEWRRASHDVQHPTSPRMLSHPLVLMTGPPSLHPSGALCCKRSMLAAQ